MESMDRRGTGKIFCEVICNVFLVNGIRECLWGHRHGDNVLSGPSIAPRFVSPQTVAIVKTYLCGLEPRNYPLIDCSNTLIFPAFSPFLNNKKTVPLGNGFC